APDPRRPEAIQMMRAALKMYDVKTCGEVKLRMMYDNPDALDLFRFCGDAGLPVTLHFDYPGATATGKEFPRRNWWYGGDIDTLERLLQLCPKTNFLGHAPGFWSHISNDDLGLNTSYVKAPVIPGGRIEQLLEHYPNLYCDISAGSGNNALRRDLDYTRKLMLRFPDRFCYARDYFDNVHQELIEMLQLPADVKELIYAGNALRLIGEK
ncbi:MAG: amidohydrolase family protein, partial [Clostridia bacterium]|nr:amidohydrolase family protein [Clostridia bacterium]